MFDFSVVRFLNQEIIRLFFLQNYFKIELKTTVNISPGYKGNLLQSFIFIFENNTHSITAVTCTTWLDKAQKNKGLKWLQPFLVPRRTTYHLCNKTA